jgi:hypothetical protein
MIKHYNIGKNNPGYKKGKAHCIICDKTLSYYKKGHTCRQCKKLIKIRKETCKCGNYKTAISKFCMKCDSERKSINYKGKNNPMFGKIGKLSGNYKDGRTMKSYYCKCGNKIHTYTFLYQGGICRSCASKEHLNGNWQGGIGKLPYSFKFNNQLKELIRKRDNYKCQKCNKTQKQELKEINRRLAIHHIDYNKMNCNKENLITLCCKCNCKVNTNRNRWKKFFRRMIS